MEKRAEDMVLGFTESHLDIESAEVLAFHNKWHEHRADTPIDFIDFHKINASIKAYAPQVLGDWKKKLVATPELEKELGILAGLIDPYVDYVNSIRRTLILQYLNTLTTTGYLDITLDSSGKETYIECKDAYNYDALGSFIKSILEAKENHIG